ncbi:hypothetical protein O181_005286 [Austropuccinia psidii MF-1]|uniref:Serine/threonine-protein kinase Tel1 n=1 Tax=Austropuccinia psidii MF-1 TaxID=1389203 RepID=A0A9Q3BH01_9BASI|nr:hypothetical protein [Austropuccinia psidii MF-1]
MFRDDNSTWDHALSLIASTTVTDRTKGIELFSDLLSNPTNMASCKESHWKAIFHQLLSTAETEKSNWLKQSASAKGASSKTGNLNRLKALISLIRKSVSQFVSVFRAKVMKLVINRVIDLVVAPNRTLIDFLALDCIRTLRDFLLYQPHLEHLTPSSSAELAAICFASILDKKLPKTLTLPNNLEFIDVPLSLSDSNSDFISHTVNPRIIDSSQLLSIILSSSSSLCLTHSRSLLFNLHQILKIFPRETSAHFHLISALHFVLRDLELNKGHDLTHLAPHLGECLLPLWSTKSNDLKEQMIICLTYLFPFVVRQVDNHQLGYHHDHSSSSQTFTKALFDLISHDKENRSSSDLISSRALRLIAPPQSPPQSFLTTKAFGWAPAHAIDSSAGRAQAITWATLKLGAFALNQVLIFSDRFSAGEFSSPRKRRKVDNILERFLRSLKPGLSTPSIIHRLQLLIIIADCHWILLDSNAQSQIVKVMLELLGTDNSIILDWVFIFWGTLAVSAPQLRKDRTLSLEANLADSLIPSIADWTQVWSYVIRRTAQPSSCRTASYVAYNLLITQQIPSQIAYDGIYNFLNDLYIQGPTFPYDSVCMLVSECLILGSANLRLSIHRLEQKALIWLTKIWPEVDRAASIGSPVGNHSQRNRRLIPEGFDAECLTRLLLSIAKLNPLPPYTPISHLPDCTITTTFLYLQTTQHIRSSLFHNQTQDLSWSPTSLQASFSSLSSPGTLPSNDISGSLNVSRQISAILYQTIGRLFEEIEGAKKTVELSLLVPPCSHLKMIIDILMAAILFECSCQVSGLMPDRQSLNTISSFLDIVLQLVGLPQWSPPERALLLSCFEPVILSPSSTSPSAPLDSLLSPGKASGLSSSKLKVPQPESPDQNSKAGGNKSLSPSHEREEFVKQVWFLHPTLTLRLQDFLTMCEVLLQSMLSTTASVVIGNTAEANMAYTQAKGTMINFDDDDDDKLDILAKSHSREGSVFSHSDEFKKKTLRNGLGTVSHEKSTISVTTICIHALITGAKMSPSIGAPQHSLDSNKIFNILDNCSGLEIIPIGIPVFNCLSAGLFCLTGKQMNQILENLGDRYLSTYLYSQNLSIRKLVIQIIQLSLPCWSNNKEEQSVNLHMAARELFQYMFLQVHQDNLQAWELRHGLNVLLHTALKLDPHGVSWASGLEIPSKDNDLLYLPINLTLRFLQDDDFRVRHGAVIFAPRNFELIHPDQHQSVEYWREVISHLPPVASELEIMLTHSLCIINTFIVSEVIRPRAYHKLLNILIQPQETREDLLHFEIVSILLKRAANQLGYSGLDELYKFYAAHVAFERSSRKDPPLHVSEKVVGKRLEEGKKIEVARAHLLAAGPQFYLSGSLNAFQTCAHLAALKEDEALRLCFPHITAQLLARACTQASASKDATIDIDHLVQPTMKALAHRSGFEQDIMQLESDRIVAHLMACAYISSQDLDTIAKSMSERSDRNVFQVLTSKLRKRHLCEPALPFYPILCIINAMKWVGQRYPVFTEPAMAYSIISHTFAALFRSPFINDHLRAICTLSIFIALSHSVISNCLPILSLLLQGSLPLISSEEHFQSICTLIQWSIGKILQPGSLHLKGHDLAGQLIISIVEAIKSVADSSSNNRDDANVARDFNAWLLNHVKTTSSTGSTHSKTLCNYVLLHWPEKQELITRCNATSLIHTCLTSASSFRLIQHFDDVALPEDKEEAGIILYNLLLSVRETKSQVRIEDCKAYLKLLYKNSGIITPPRLGRAVASSTKSNLGEAALNSEAEIISQIFAITTLLLQTSDFQLMLRISEFIHKGSSLEMCPDFQDPHCWVPPLLAGRASLISHQTLCRPYDVHQLANPAYLNNFSALEGLAKSSKQWTSGFLQLLIASRAESRPFYSQLSSLIEINDELAAELLPRVLHANLLHEAQSQLSTLKKKVSQHISAILRSSSTDQMVIARVLNLITYLRYHPRPGDDPLGSDKWLQVSWIEIAKHATQLGNSALGFLFIEVGREHGLSVDLSSLTDPDLQSILGRLCANAPEPDAFYSLSPTDPMNFLLQRYQHESLWDSAFGLHGAILEGTNVASPEFSEAMTLIANYLSNSGLNRLAHAVLDTQRSNHHSHQNQLGLDSTKAQVQSTLPFELAWRASNWDLPVTDQLDLDSSTRVYGALQSYNRDRDLRLQTQVLETCMLGQFQELVKTTIGSAQTCSKVIGSALALCDISSLLRRGKEEETFKSFLTLPSGCEHTIIEQVSAVRRSLLQTVLHGQSATQLERVTSDILRVAQETEIKLRIRTSQEARYAGHLQAALNIIIPFSNFAEGEIPQARLEAKEEFANVLWAKGEQTLALNTLKAVQVSHGLLPEAAVRLSRLGDWISFARLNSPTEIIDLYFTKAIESLDSSKYPEAFGQVAFTYAKFADKQYHELIESGQVQKLTESTQRLKAEVSATQQAFRSDREGQKVLEWKKRIFREDKEKLDLLSELQTRYLFSALEMYLNCLGFEDRHDDIIFRFVSLWFDEHANKALNVRLQSLIGLVSTYKFVRVAHQLLARITRDSDSPFQTVLGQLVTKLCQDHPFHTLFQILLIQRGIPSLIDIAPHSRSRRASQISTQPTLLTPVEMSRANAAQTVLLEISQVSRRKEVLQQVIAVHQAYKEWASCDVRKNPEFLKGGKPVNQLPARFMLTSLKDLSVPVPTSKLQIDKTCRYLPENMACISGYETKFKTAGGIHAPKITYCRGSDGKRYTQLFKGGDDIRQDAIMEQVFQLVNEVLRRDPDCQKRRLNFKTYNVIPLSSDSGVIEFVENTRSLLEILLPVHVKYNEPPDWDITRIKKYLNLPRDTLIQERRKRFEEVVAHCRPAMRFWFFEAQKCPQKWYEMRLNFTRSTATASIVGHILGLGDRHLSNILIDKVTGEMVQIDLGIAFDNGKLLPIPETVPFRLTRDIIDGFGVAKTEGVFRRCCEQTLRVLRENRDLIMTIIDVLKHDPLQAWVITEQKAKEMQGVQEILSSSTSSNRKLKNNSEPQVSENASRALASVENKLSGDLSVETTVTQLILEATNIDNLGGIFVGWSPFY